tara:strand:- start:386 stop:838 length:453 start_codon:yes stop_codon:yes gene_type:complete
MTTSNTKSTEKTTPKHNLFEIAQKRSVSGTASKRFDPIADQDNRLMQLRELNALGKKIKVEIDELRESFKGDLRAALEDSEENPKIRHSEDEKIHVYLSVRKKFKFSEKLQTKRQKLDNQMADLKAEEAKEVRNQKATLLSKSYTVSFKS